MYKGKEKFTILFEDSTRIITPIKRCVKLIFSICMFDLKSGVIIFAIKFNSKTYVLQMLYLHFIYNTIHENCEFLSIIEDFLSRTIYLFGEICLFNVNDV